MCQQKKRKRSQAICANKLFRLRIGGKMLDKLLIKS